jgi:hypothetical protein
MCIGPGEIPLVQRPEPSASKMQLNVSHPFLYISPVAHCLNGSQTCHINFAFVTNKKTQKSYSESPTRDLDDIVSCYIHSPMSDSVLNSPDDILLHIQAFHDAIWKSYTIKQNSATLSNPSVVVKWVTLQTEEFTVSVSSQTTTIQRQQRQITPSETALYGC